MSRMTCMDEEGVVSTARRGDRRNDRYGFQDCLEKLYTYENLEEEGYLLVTPCLVGDPVYLIEETEEGYKISDREFDYHLIYDYGTSVFSTKEGAEQEIERRKKNEE